MLAYDLALQSYQAVDVGHIDLEYEWFLAGKGIRISVPYKYNNEFTGGNRVDEIHALVHDSQVIVSYLFKSNQAWQIIMPLSVGQVGKMQQKSATQSFDYILFGDVLEHLHDPLKTIQYCRRFLKDEGYILASIPNLMHISVMEGLLRGNFTYTEMGLLDKTHIHFFTFNEIVRMFNAGGYEIEDMRPVTFPVSAEQESLIVKLLELQRGASRHMYESFQYVVRARISV